MNLPRSAAYDSRHTRPRRRGHRGRRRDGGRLISSALSETFRVAVYQYAVTGATLGAFDNGLLQNAFDRHNRQR